MSYLEKFPQGHERSELHGHAIHCAICRQLLDHVAHGSGPLARGVSRIDRRDRAIELNSLDLLNLDLRQWHP
eukprot:1618062-Pyramimonas_sp.AAC.1